MYKCNNCGHIFDEGEQVLWTESHGEKVSGCPLCKSDYEETKPCKLCRSQHAADELWSEVCEECIDKYKFDIHICKKVGDNSTESIKINSFLAEMFSEDEIEEILFREINLACKNSFCDCSSFIENDKEWFAKNLIKEVE